MAEPASVSVLVSEESVSALLATFIDDCTTPAELGTVCSAIEAAAQQPDLVVSRRFALKALLPLVERLLNPGEFAPAMVPIASRGLRAAMGLIVRHLRLCIQTPDAAATSGRGKGLAPPAGTSPGATPGAAPSLEPHGAIGWLSALTSIANERSALWALAAKHEAARGGDVGGGGAHATLIRGFLSEGGADAALEMLDEATHLAADGSVGERDQRTCMSPHLTRALPLPPHHHPTAARRSYGGRVVRGGAQPTRRSKRRFRWAISRRHCAASCHLPCAMTCRRWLLLKQLRCVRRSIC